MNMIEGIKELYLILKGLSVEGQISLIRYCIYMIATGVEIWLFIWVLERKSKRGGIK